VNSEKVCEERQIMWLGTLFQTTKHFAEKARIEEEGAYFGKSS